MRLRSGLRLPLGIALAACATACAEVAQKGGRTGSPAPDYAAPTLAGDTLSLAGLRGQPVLLNVWATWCPPCRKETPELQALHETHGPRGLRVVGVSIDASGSRDLVEEFLKEYQVTYPILLDPEDRISNVLAIEGVPVTILIDREGTVVWRKLGAFTTEDEELRSALARVLP